MCLECQAVVVVSRRLNGLGCGLLLSAPVYPAILWFFSPTLALAVLAVYLLTALTAGHGRVCGECRSRQLAAVGSEEGRKVLGE